jgi:ATP-dependent exoDNAse (exonuclease V) beta subunit
MDKIEEIKKELECFNDKDFKFYPKEHIYKYKSVKYTSVTTFIKNFHEEFDKDYWSKNKAEKYGIKVDELLKNWQEKNDRANQVGSATHDWIENYFNGIWQNLPTDIDVIDRINKFNILYAKHLYKLKPVKFELRVFSKKYPLAGTIDSIFLYKGNLFILDWKTNSEFKHDKHPRGKFQKLLKPLENEYQNHLNEYSIQVGLYSIILKEWGFDVKGAYLAHFGPNAPGTIYKAKDFREKLEEYLSNYNWY